MKLLTLFAIFFVVSSAFIPNRSFKNKIRLNKSNYSVNHNNDNFIILKSTLISIIIGELIVMPILMSYKELLHIIANSNNIDSTAMLTSNFF